MMPQLSGWLWFVIDVAMVVVLGCAMIYGIAKWRHRRRDPAMEQARNRGTQRVYRAEEARRQRLHEE